MESKKAKDCRKFMEQCVAHLNESAPTFADLNLEAVSDLILPRDYARALQFLRMFEYFDHLTNQQLVNTSILELFD
jgi:hypothetical protein